MFKSVNNYCERLDTTYWAEPFNALSNSSFILLAIFAYFMIRKNPSIGPVLLTIILFSIGIGSFLFHTYARVWAEIADIVPILLFILVYIFFSTHIYLRQNKIIASLSVIAFFPFAIGTSALIGAVFGPLNGSNLYVSVALLIAFYATAMIRQNPKTASGLAIGAAILAVSITFRSIDQTICETLPLGTHFLWHSLNGVMLGWMILVLHRHLNSGLHKRDKHSLAPS